MVKTRSQREFEAKIRQSRGIAHPAAPRDGGGGWATLCARPECEITFHTPTKQRKYCSTECRRLVEQAKENRIAVLSGMLLYTCAAPRCQNVFLPEPRNHDHQFCSDRCRKRAHRRDSDLSALNCAWCKRPLPAGKTRRREYCDARCRKRAQRAANKK